MIINKAFLKRLQKLSNQELIGKATAFKYQGKAIDSPITQSKGFNINYDTIILELRRRNLLR